MSRPALRELHSANRLSAGGCAELSLAREICPPLCEFSILRLAVRQCAPHARLVDRGDFAYGLCLITSGSGEVQLADQWHPAQAGQALILRLGKTPEFRGCEQPWQNCLITYWNSPGRPAPPAFAETRIIPADTDTFLSLICMICREGTIPDNQSTVRHLLHVLDRHVQRLIAPNCQIPSLAELWDVVNSDLTRDWSIEMLADISRMSVSTLLRQCRRELHCSPMDQVTRLRIGRAASLLVADTANVAEAAAAVGYTNAFAFSRAFKRVQGIAPKQFQLQLQPKTLTNHLLRDATNFHQYRKTARHLTSEAFPLITAGRHGGFACVPIEHLLNRKLGGNDERWLGDEPLDHLRPGRRCYHGIPFLIHQKAIVFASARRQTLRALPNWLIIPCTQRVRAIYVLHACGWEPGAQTIADWRMVLDGGLSHRMTIRSFRQDPVCGNIADWWPSAPPGRSEHALPVIVRSSDPRDVYERHLYVAQWRTLQPQTPLSTFEVLVPADSSSVYAILAITLLLD